MVLGALFFAACDRAPEPPRPAWPASTTTRASPTPPTTTPPAVAPDVSPRARAAYVRRASDAIGGRAREDALLELARAHGVRALHLYGLGPLLMDEDGRARLAAFLRRARAAGIAEIGAPIAGLDRLQAIALFEQQHEPARFDVVTTELEYWNGCGEGAGRVECFRRFVALLDAMRGEARRRGWQVGAYLGHPTDEEAAVIAARVDRVHVDVGVTDPERSFTRTRDGRPLAARWRALSGRGVAIWPILYAVGDVNLGAWLAQRRSLDDAERVLREAYERERQHGPGADPPAGFVWFALDALP